MGMMSLSVSPSSAVLSTWRALLVCFICIAVFSPVPCSAAGNPAIIYAQKNYRGARIYVRQTSCTNLPNNWRDSPGSLMISSQNNHVTCKIFTNPSCRQGGTPPTTKQSVSDVTRLSTDTFRVDQTWSSIHCTVVPKTENEKTGDNAGRGQNPNGQPQGTPKQGASQQPNHHQNQQKQQQQQQQQRPTSPQVQQEQQRKRTPRVQREVNLFTLRDFRGQRLKMTVTVGECSIVPSQFANMIQSVSFPVQYVMEMFQTGRCRSNHPLSVGVLNEPTLNLQLVRNGFNRNLRSFRLVERNAYKVEERKREEKEELPEIVLFSGENFQGHHKTFLFSPLPNKPLESDCIQLEGMFLGSLGSIWMAAGLNVKLFSGVNCQGTIRQVSNSLEIASRSRLNDFGISLKILKPNVGGVFVYKYANYLGPSQFLRSGSHSVQRLLYNDDISSIKVPDGWQATLYKDSPPGAKFVVVKSDISDLKSIHFDNEASDVKVEPICDPPCSHGRCYAPSRCTCDKGWRGMRCNEQVPDLTSAVVCDRNEYFIGETAHCELLARSEGSPAPTLIKYFTLSPTSLPASQGYATPDGRTHTRIVNRQRFYSQIDQQKAREISDPTPSLHFNVSILHTTEGYTKLFTVRVNEGEIYTPVFRVFERPDNTSTVECSRMKLLRSQPVTCSILPRKSGKGIVTLSRGFSLSQGKVGKVGPLVAVFDKDTSKTNEEEWMDSASSGDRFTFLYVVHRLPAVQKGENTVKLTSPFIVKVSGSEGGGERERENNDPSSLSLSLSIPSLRAYQPDGDDHLGQAKAL